MLKFVALLFAVLIPFGNIFTMGFPGMLKDKDDYETPEIGGKTTATDDRIHYIKLYNDKDTKNCDAIVIESNGHFGLVDAAYDNDKTDGEIIPESETGVAVREYLLDLGVEHLDFIIATHSHSDHIGGMPIIADSHDGHKLVDENTIYFYKPYKPNLVEDAKVGWYNGKRYSVAFEAMDTANAQMVDVNSVDSTKLNKSNSDFKNSTINIIRELKIDVSASNEDQHRLSFEFGDFKMELFNLHYQSDYDENSNSIVAYLEKNDQGTILLGDIGVVNDAECKIGDVIKTLHDNIQVIKVGHHGSSNSTSRSLLNLLEPKYLVITGADFDTEKYPNNCDAPFCIYMKNKASVYYTKDMKGRAVVQVMTDDISFVDAKEANGKMTFTDIADSLSLNSGRNGWAKWVTYRDEKDENIEKIDWYFINSDGSFICGWLDDAGKRYYLGDDGIMVTGWKKIDGKWYYLKPDGSMAAKEYIDGYWINPNGSWTYEVTATWYEDGTGWYYQDKKGWYPRSRTLWIDNELYVFNDKGYIETGWKKNDSKWYYFLTNGKAAKGWKEIDGIWYYFNDDCVMATGWKKVDGKWYYFLSNGEVVKGWKEINGKWYFFKEDFSMAVKEYCNGYWLDSNGTWTYEARASWKKDSKGWYYTDSTGWYAKNKIFKINGKDYIFNNKGYLIEE